MGMRQRLGVAACLLGDPQLLILDEPMNGLDPAGMQDMRDMILGLVAEGRTVMLSSHLLDEVERTCDAVAIVDRGRVIRQGPISQLLSGSSFESRSSAPIPTGPAACSPRHARCRRRSGPRRARRHPPAGHGRDVIAEVNRVLVEGGISVYRLQHVQASLESWFLAGHQPTGGVVMTTIADSRTAPSGSRRSAEPSPDHRGSWIPTWGMVATRFMELRGGGG